MSDRPIGLGKVAENGTLNENGAFYSVQDINVLLENGGGSSGGELPTPTVADAGSVVVVGEDGKYELGEAGGGDLPTPTVADAGKAIVVDAEGKYALGEAGGGLIVHITTQDRVTYLMDKSYSEIKTAILSGIMPIFIEDDDGGYANYQLTVILDGNNSDPYLVIVYQYDANATPPILAFEFMSDTETGVLTATAGGGTT